MDIKAFIEHSIYNIIILNPTNEYFWVESFFYYILLTFELHRKLNKKLFKTLISGIGKKINR